MWILLHAIAAPGRRCVSYQWKELEARDLRWLDTVFQGQYLPSLSINYVIAMLLPRCHCNPDHNKFSSLSNTTVVAIFPNLCLWRRSLFSNFGRYWPCKTVSNHLKKVGQVSFANTVMSFTRPCLQITYEWHNYCFVWNYFVLVIDHFEFVRTKFLKATASVRM